MPRGARKMKETDRYFELLRKPDLTFTSKGGERRLRINWSDVAVTKHYLIALF